MFIKPFLRDKMPHLLGLMFILAFLAALLGALGLSWKPIVFLSAVCALCVVNAGVLLNTMLAVIAL